MRFWLSKPATVTATTAAGSTRRLSLSGGWHSLGWSEPKRAGFYAVHVGAVDWAGNRAAFDTLPIVRAAATAPQPKAGPSHGGRTRCRATPARRGCGHCRPRPGPGRARRRLAAGSLRRLVAGRSGCTGSGLVAALQRVPARLGIVVDLYAAPADDAGRAALAQYGASLVQQVPLIRDVLLAPAPTVAAAPSYAATLAALRECRRPDRHPCRGRPADRRRADSEGRAGCDRPGARRHRRSCGHRRLQARAGGRQEPLDGRERATGDGRRRPGFANVPPVLVDGVVATPTAAADLISGAACSTTLQGIVLEQLTADARLTAAVAAAQRGTVVCPGLAAGVDATTLTFPETLAPPAAAQVVLGCSRDCLYLVTLVRADGTPVVANRGALRGGAARRDGHAAADDAQAGHVHDRRAARGAGQSGRRDAADEPRAAGRLGTSSRTWFKHEPGSFPRQAAWMSQPRYISASTASVTNATACRASAKV